MWQCQLGAGNEEDPVVSLPDSPDWGAGQSSLLFSMDQTPVGAELSSWPAARPSLQRGHRNEKQAGNQSVTQNGQEVGQAWGWGGITRGECVEQSPSVSSCLAPSFQPLGQCPAPRLPLCVPQTPPFPLFLLKSPLRDRLRLFPVLTALMVTSTWSVPPMPSEYVCWEDGYWVTG